MLHLLSVFLKGEYLISSNTWNYIKSDIRIQIYLYIIIGVLVTKFLSIQLEINQNIVEYIISMSHSYSNYKVLVVREIIFFSVFIIIYAGLIELIVSYINTNTFKKNILSIGIRNNAWNVLFLILPRGTGYLSY